MFRVDCIKKPKVPIIFAINTLNTHKAALKSVLNSIKGNSIDGSISINNTNLPTRECRDELKSIEMSVTSPDKNGHSSFIFKRTFQTDTGLSCHESNYETLEARVDMNSGTILSIEASSAGNKLSKSEGAIESSHYRKLLKLVKRSLKLDGRNKTILPEEKKLIKDLL